MKIIFKTTISNETLLLVWKDQPEEKLMKSFLKDPDSWVSKGHVTIENQAKNVNEHDKDLFQVGQILYANCGGLCSPESKEDKRIEAMGLDWMIAREIESGNIVYFKLDAYSKWKDLAAYTTPSKSIE